MLPGRLTGRQTNLALEVALVAALGSGLASWIWGDRWNGWAVTVHAVVGLSLLLLAPAKLAGPVRAGFRRRRTGRFVSAAFGVLVVVTVAVGVAHSTGLWFGVGYWSALWTHTLVGFALVPLLVWHVGSRPVRPRPADLDRRAALRIGGITAVAAGVVAAQRPATDAFGLAGGDRRHTGSHERGSYDPARMPTVSWFDDERPADVTPATWRLTIAGTPVAVADLERRSEPLVARLDCTGGWFAEQSWDAVSLGVLLGDTDGRSIVVRSATGYQRRFPLADADRLHLAVGYGGATLRAGHGAPIRLVAPGRRGFEWVKWVRSVDVESTPSWWQPPLPLT